MFKIGDKIKALKDHPLGASRVTQGDIVEVITEPYDDSIRLFRSFEYAWTNPIDPNEIIVYIGDETDFTLLRAPSLTYSLVRSMTVPSLKSSPSATSSANYTWRTATFPSPLKFDLGVKRESKKCECGSSHVGSQYHSPWCQLFTK